MSRLVSKSVSIDVRLIERKDIGYFRNSKMFNKKNELFVLVSLYIADNQYCIYNCNLRFICSVL